jgi:signal transduction histidine kinase
VQSTPLCSRDGELLGMLSTHFRDPHRPSERELRLTDLYVLQVAEMIERKRAERLLREANEKVELVLDSITDNAFGFSKDWRYTYLNKHAAEQIRTLGKDPAGLIGRTLWEEFPVVPNEETFRRVMSERVAITDELYYEPLGEWVENHMYPSRDGGLVTFQKYITERKRAEERLRRSEAYLVEAERLSHTGSWAWNVASGELFWSAESFKPTLDSARQLIHPHDLVFADQVFARAIQAGRDFEHDLRFVRPDGTVRYVHSLAHPSFDESGNVSEYVGTVMDITERREEEEARKELSRRLVVAQEEERRRISRELHDELGQQLSALKLNLAALRREQGGRGDMDDAVASLEAMARQLDSDVDFIVLQLRPTALDDLGLATALTKYVADWSAHFHVQAQLHLSGIEPGRLTDEVATTLYRLSQEALNNVAKHAQATRVQILLEARLDHTSLIVEDDGQGFEAGQAFDMARKGLGLIGMRERAALLGGTLAVESSQGRGTTVVARIPAPRPASGQVT